MSKEAILSSKGNFTSFSYGEYVIRFRTSPKLEKYTKVLEWDHGYIVVMAKYQNCIEEEEYIDLIPTLKNLNIDPDKFLKPITGVKIVYD